MSETREVQLARELIAGNAAVFEEFVELFRKKVFQFSIWMCKSREDAEEIAQESLFKAFQNFHQLDDPARVKPWIFRIAKNACFMKRRKSVFAPAEELSLDELMPKLEGGGSGIQIADWSALPEDQVLRAELNEQLNEAIRSLPELYRSVLIFRDVEGLTTEQTAEVLEVSLEVVKTRLHRGRLAVRKKLDEYFRSAQHATPVGSK